MSDRPLERILYVEDDPDIQAIAIIALRDVGEFTVETCSSGAEALATAAEFNADLFLLDVMLPGMDGPTLLQELRAIPACAQTPAMFMTAKVQSRDIPELMAHGVLDIIPKPFDPMSLASDIRARWQRHSE